MVDKKKMKRRASDGGFMCVLALRMADFWTWVDRRQIDAYAVSCIILYGTISITNWAMSFVDKHPDKPGLEVAAIIGAVMVPWSGLQAACVKWLFEARQRSFLPGDK